MTPHTLEIPDLEALEERLAEIEHVFASATHSKYGKDVGKQLVITLNRIFRVQHWDHSDRAIKLVAYEGPSFVRAVNAYNELG